MPNSEPSAIEYAVGSRQKRMDNFYELVNFLHAWKNGYLRKMQVEPSLLQSIKAAERYCDVHFQYGHVSKKDITQQALMKVNLL